MVNHERLATLLTHRSKPAVTVTLPTAVKGPETQQSAIRLKNLLRAASDELGATPEGRSALAWLSAFQEDEDFWQHQRSGLMLLASPTEREVWRLPFECPASVHVGDRFHLKHAIRVANSPGFEVLAFSRGAVRLFTCDASHVEEVEVEGLIRSLDEFMKFDAVEEQLQSHISGGSSGPGGRLEMTHHGHGAGEDRRTLDLERFALSVAKTLDGRRARMKHAPLLVLAATSRDAAAYRNASKDPHLSGQVIEGNPDRTDPETLRQKGYGIADEEWRRRRSRAAERFRVAEGAGRTSTTLNGVLSAAHQGRVETLFAAADAEKLGSYDPLTSHAVVSPTAGGGASDLIDEAACVALQHGADVHIVPTSEIPGGTLVAATLRD